jgi:hypothetical protein
VVGKGREGEGMREREEIDGAVCFNAYCEGIVGIVFLRGVFVIERCVERELRALI